jgi:hypothetical protein
MAWRRTCLVTLAATAAVALACVGGAQDETSVPRAPSAPMLLVSKDRVIVQRGFVPVDDTLRLYACVVGTPAGVHYAYDLQTGALLSLWHEKVKFVTVGLIRETIVFA